MNVSIYRVQIGKLRCQGPLPNKLLVTQAQVPLTILFGEDFDLLSGRHLHLLVHHFDLPLLLKSMLVAEAGGLFQLFALNGADQDIAGSVWLTWVSHILFELGVLLVIESLCGHVELAMRFAAAVCNIVVFKDLQLRTTAIPYTNKLRQLRQERPL
jgi:hypothetical protein